MPRWFKIVSVIAMLAAMAVFAITLLMGWGSLFTAGYISRGLSLVFLGSLAACYAVVAVVVVVDELTKKRRDPTALTVYDEGDDR